MLHLIRESYGTRRLLQHRATTVTQIFRFSPHRDTNHWSFSNMGKYQVGRDQIFRIKTPSQHITQNLSQNDVYLR